MQQVNHNLESGEQVFNGHYYPSQNDQHGYNRRHMTPSEVYPTTQGKTFVVFVKMCPS